MDKRITYGIHGIERIDASTVRIRRIHRIRHIAVESWHNRHSILHLHAHSCQAHERQETTLLFLVWFYCCLVGVVMHLAKSNE